MIKTPFNDMHSAGFTLLETLVVAVVAALLLLGALILGSNALDRRKVHAFIEEATEISAAVHDLYGNVDSYSGVSVSALAPKLPATFLNTAGTSIRSPYGEAIVVGIDTTVAGTKAALNTQGVMLQTIVPLSACADLIMALQGSYDYVVVGTNAPMVVANLPSVVPTPSNALSACTKQTGSGSTGDDRVNQPITLYLVRT